MATASQSLFNMSVAADVSPSNQTLLMPKLAYRFRLLFLGFGIGDSTEMTRQVIDCSRPNASFAEITLPVYNSTMYLAGKSSWAPLSVNIRDDASGSVSRSLGYQLQKQMDFVEQASASSGSDYKFQLNMDMLDGGNGVSDPVILERWEIYGCWVVNANYNNVNYSENADVKIALSIRFDNAIQAPLGTGVGSSVLRGNPFGTTTGIGAAR